MISCCSVSWFLRYCISRALTSWNNRSVAVFLALLIGACAANKSALQHYDECAVENSSFEAMVACGKQRRMAYCQENNNCSADGKAFVAQANSLVMSVNRHEMTEAEAQRRWVVSGDPRLANQWTSTTVRHLLGLTAGDHVFLHCSPRLRRG
jgi:hypothetical protein